MPRPDPLDDLSADVRASQIIADLGIPLDRLTRCLSVVALWHAEEAAHDPERARSLRVASGRLSTLSDDIRRLVA